MKQYLGALEHDRKFDYSNVNIATSQMFDIFKMTILIIKAVTRGVL